MAEPSDICAVILAAGASRRFGDEDKLAALLHGKMLGLHISHRLAEFNFGCKIIITAKADHPCAADWKKDGFEIAVNADAAQGLGSSVALAAKRAQECQSGGLLICLADMPFVPVSHFQLMVDRFDSDSGAACLATAGSGHISPPAIFGRNLLEGMKGLDGDKGARQLLQTAEQVELADEFLVDVDNPQILERLNANMAKF